MCRVKKYRAGQDRAASTRTHPADSFVVFFLLVIVVVILQGLCTAQKEQPEHASITQTK